MGGPYEPFGDDRVALIVDLQPSVVHEPRPGALDDPSPGQDLEPVVVDLVDHFGGDVVGTAGGDEGPLEPAVAPDLLQPSRPVPRPVDDGHAADVVRHVGGDHEHGDEKAHGVDHSEGLPARHLLPGVVSPCGAGDRRRAAHTPGVDHPGRGIGLPALLPSDLFGQPRTDLLPDPVLGPPHVVAVHGVPVWVVGREGPPLTARRRHVEDGVHDVALVPLGRTPDATTPGVGGDQIGDQLPLLVGQITVGGPPGLRNGLARRCHHRSIWRSGHRKGSIQPLNWSEFSDSF